MIMLNKLFDEIEEEGKDQFTQDLVAKAKEVLAQFTEENGKSKTSLNQLKEEKSENEKDSVKTDEVEEEKEEED